MPAHKVTYFAFPGKAEATRLTAALAGVSFEDEQLTGEQWGAKKASVQPMQLPILTVDGEEFGQSAAQVRYFGKLAGLYPEDPLQALRVDEVMDYVGEVFAQLSRTFEVPDGPERAQARAAIMAPGGAARKWIEMLDKRLEGKTYVANDSFSIADVCIFSWLQIFESGFLDGVPKDSLKDLANLQRLIATVRANEKVKAYYANAEGAWKMYQ